MYIYICICMYIWCVYVFLYFSGGVAVRGLYFPSPPAFENVMCPSNATSALDCSLSPPISPRCFMNSSAAGVQCIYRGLSWALDLMFIPHMICMCKLIRSDQYVVLIVNWGPGIIVSDIIIINSPKKWHILLLLGSLKEWCNDTMSSIDQ